MKIANVVYEKELVNHKEVEYVNYFKGPTQYEKLDNTLPTLYVGWSFMKASNPNNEIIQHADILKKKIIGNELYWECSYEESKTSHIKGVDSFINAAPQFYFLPKYLYVNLDPVFFQLKDVQDLMDVLPKKIDYTYIFKNEMIYVQFENKIWGINLGMYDFFKFSTEEIIGKLSERTQTTFSDTDGSTYLSYYKILPNFTHLKRYLISILSK